MITSIIFVKAYLFIIYHFYAVVKQNPIAPRKTMKGEYF